MGTDHSKSPTELREYLTLLRQRDANGQPFIIVGGHAANFWAEFYSERESKLKTLLPFVSKDLDLIGTEAEAARVAGAIGWHLSPPPVGGGPVQAVLSSQPGGNGLTAEFLSQIKGVSTGCRSRRSVVRFKRCHECHSPGPGGRAAESRNGGDGEMDRGAIAHGERGQRQHDAVSVAARQTQVAIHKTRLHEWPPGKALTCLRLHHTSEN